MSSHETPAAVAAADQGHAAARDTIARLVRLTRDHRAGCDTPGCAGFDVDQILGPRDADHLHGLLVVALVDIADGGTDA